MIERSERQSREAIERGATERDDRERRSREAIGRGNQWLIERGGPKGNRKRRPGETAERGGQRGGLRGGDGGWKRNGGDESLHSATMELVEEERIELG